MIKAPVRNLKELEFSVKQFDQIFDYCKIKNIGFYQPVLTFKHGNSKII